MPSILLSVIVCTRNRATELVNCLRDLAEKAQQYPDVEVVVVDNGSTDNTAQIVERVASQFHCNLRYVLEPQAGLCRARNCGGHSSRGEVLAYIDDDEIISPTWVGAVRSHFVSGKSDCMGGKVEVCAEGQLPEWFPGDALWILGASQLGETPQIIEYPLHPPGGNFAFTRKVFDTIGGFDPRLTLYGDEADFFRRVSSKGFTTMYDPSILVVQRIPANRLNKRSLMRKGYLWGRGSAMLSMLASPGPRRRAAGLLEYAARTAYVGGSMAFRSGFGRAFTFWHNLGYLMQFAKGAR